MIPFSAHENLGVDALGSSPPQILNICYSKFRSKCHENGFKTRTFQVLVCKKKIFLYDKCVGGVAKSH